MDFDRTYLMSSSGKGVPTKDEPINNVYININDPSTKTAYLEGMQIDEQKKSYIIPIDAMYTKMYTNNTSEKHFNILHGISSNGSVKNVEVGVNKSKVSVDRLRNVRVPYNNFGVLDNMKNAIEGESHMLTISKSSIDTSIITLNKHYVVNNVEAYRHLNGDFLLAKKVESYQRNGDYFTSECLLTFRSTNK